jgi:uncharacterized protein (TIGR02391 family)
MHYLSEILREKTGIDSDGVSLVGQSLGGDEPKLRINKLQTQSERDEQKGIMQIVMGLYMGIRNPRSHEQREDTKNIADPIIYFIDYLTRLLDASKPPFTISEFLIRVFDPDFVEKERYAELLVNDIPVSKRLETLIEIYRGRLEGDIKKIRFISNEIFSSLTDTEIDEFFIVVSDELSTATDQKSIISTLQMIPYDYWHKVEESARMRIENKLIISIKNGESILNSDKLRDGALGTWASGMISFFTLKSELTEVLFIKLKDSDEEDNLYVLTYFLYDLPALFDTASSRMICVDAMYRVLIAGDQGLKTKMFNFLISCPSEWKDKILEKFKDYTDYENPDFYLPDGTPFLGNLPEPSPEDIPF